MNTKFKNWCHLFVTTDRLLMRRDEKKIYWIAWNNLDKKSHRNKDTWI